MPFYIVEDTALTSIADAIRDAGGTTASLLFPQGFIDAINAIGGGGNVLTTVTISTATNTAKDSYDALQAAIGQDKNWVAFVDNDAYITGGGDKCVAIVGCKGNVQRSIYRNDANYSYMRMFPYSTDVVKIPANTEFKVFIFPAQPAST